MHGVRNYTTPAPPEARDYSLFRKYGRIGAMSAILCHDAAIAGVSACVPPAAVDNLARCTPVCGPEKAATAVKTTGFRTLRVAPPGCGTFDLCLAAARRAVGESPFSPAGFGALVAVTVTPGDEMPALANRLHRALGFPPAAAALDIRAACAGYVYGLHAAAMYAAATGRPVLLADGDVQTSVADPADPATLPVFSDAGTATVVCPAAMCGAPPSTWRFAFLSEGDPSGALRLPWGGRIAMDGFAVFRFATGPALDFLRGFLSSAPADEPPPSVFVPHQANMYMVRRIAQALGFAEDRVWTSGESYGNCGSASVPLTIAHCAAAAPQAPSPSSAPRRLFLGAFGGGLAAAAAAVDLPCGCPVSVFPLPQGEG